MRFATATTAGYHGAHVAIQTSGPPPFPGIAAAARAVPSGYIYNNVQLGYCWTHGLTKHPEHTSATCNHPSSSHQITATLDRHMGGSKTTYAGIYILVSNTTTGSSKMILTITSRESCTVL